jgi:hypothetical protein
LAKVFHLFEPSRELVVFQHQFPPFLFVLVPIKLPPKPLGRKSPKNNVFGSLNRRVAMVFMGFYLSPY